MSNRLFGLRRWLYEVRGISGCAKRSIDQKSARITLKSASLKSASLKSASLKFALALIAASTAKRQLSASTLNKISPDQRFLISNFIFVFD
jgi:hypothetical protein